MSIFKYLDYRSFLNDELKKRKKDIPSFTQERLCQQVGIRTTYLSNVLKGRGNFNSDQIYSLAHHLKLTPEEAQYLFLLKEYDQSVSKDRKSQLKSEIDRLSQKAHKTENHLSAKVRKDEHDLIMKYYGDPNIKIVHVLLQIPRYANNYQKISEDLNMQSDYLHRIFNQLAELEIIRFDQKKIEVLKKNYHLPKESPMLLPHQLLMRMRSGQRLQEVEADKRFSFSVTFTGTEETRQSIHERFLVFLKEIEKFVKDSPTENAYQINFDLFPWNR
jgi:uncharacterized protein (TIGR02147 family)